MEALPIVGISIWLIVKIFFLVGLLVYLVFAFVVLRQINIMNETLDVGFEVPVRILGYVHFFFVIALIIIVFVTPV